ncbi:FkbM family methyltransferase [Phreatobacter aquaticus]|nr:FkbM family methyltransferase [Phreatobacter aquaticus]
MTSQRFTCRIPMDLDCPAPMRDPVAYVLDGEYESHYDGEGLTILDIGANIGSFARWAELRWPGSTIHCYEPNPGTFEFLKRNTEGRTGIHINKAALFPGAKPQETYVSRFAGDGEGGLASYAGDTFLDGVMGESFQVDVVDPATLASADIVKIDIEGGEAEVLAHLDLSKTSLVLLEFQNGRNRERIREVMPADFEVLRDEACEWEPILGYKGYRPDLAGDVYGRMFYLRRGTTRLRPSLPAA